ncbi:alpha-N-acetylgalactosaminide alpha-2,6-sialyltransferase 1 [Hippopotamus amphibius kiboko]|uniref:alpha-N-acetylgalactosaminide alpha-2,6-sialyltransferase 1 n=1 Tax=Hippopotamus amphibius kiboko TaxID=575201 RepID=UPI002591F20B|nr:alpha-N-acetylgalactosaminide alpha-2,6-sialyltransferase 1 [Hippopotamus amphibius kiboko]
MRPCLRRLSRLGHALQWLLLLAGFLFIFALSSFIKEPNTKPARNQHRGNIKERSPELLQKAMSQAPTAGSRTSAHMEPAQGTSTRDTHPEAATHRASEGRGAEAGKASAKEPGRVPNTASTAALETQPSKDTVGHTLPPGAQGIGVASGRMEAPSLNSQDPRTTKGSGDEEARPTAPRTVPTKPEGSVAATARTPLPENQAGVWTPTGAGPTGRGTRGATTAAVPPKDGAQATPSSAPLQSPTTQRGQRLQAANFKSEPRWDFEEKYSLEVGGLQTTCPDSVKIKASKSPWLQKLFMPNLTLFLDSRHFNQSEWDRLEHFAPPFGFMELNFSLVQKVVPRFPPVPQQQLLLASLPAGSSQCISCAVVGNGGILNNSQVGPEIDGHDYVFRLSGAVIKGYEQDVGTRTSFYGFTAFSLTQSLFILGDRGFRHVPLGKDVRYLHFLEGTRDYEWLEALLLNQTVVTKKLFWFRHRPQEAFRETLQLDRYLLLHPDLLRYMKNRFLRSKTLNTIHWRIYRPTTGALLLLTALQLCDQVSAYGFITEGHERFSDHYYDKSWKKTIFYTNHDFKLEKSLWKRLHDEGIIRLYQRPVTSKPNI